MTEPFSYSNSDHNEEPAAAPAGPAAPTALAAPANTEQPRGPLQFDSFSEVPTVEAEASDVPDEIQKLREADAPRRMFSAQKVYATALPEAPNGRTSSGRRAGNGARCLPIWV